jgi:hypothetical protein
MTFRPGVCGNFFWQRERPQVSCGAHPRYGREERYRDRQGDRRSAKLGDVECRRRSLKYLLPSPRLIATPVSLPAAQSAAEAQDQIAQLTVMAARGDLDMDAVPVLTRSLTLSIDTRLARLEELVGKRESENAT